MLLARDTEGSGAKLGRRTQGNFTQMAAHCGNILNSDALILKMN